MVSHYKIQVDEGRGFLHEHPASATSWNEKAVVEIAAMPNVEIVTADQCQYGLESPTPHGGNAPAKKPTRFMTNAEPLGKLLQKRCDKLHTH